MTTPVIVLGLVAVVLAVLLVVVRSQLQKELEQARHAIAESRAEAQAARKEAKERAEDRKGRSEELTDAREKLRDAKKKLHDAQEETRKLRELAAARAHEARVLEDQVAQAREEAAHVADELRRAKEESGSPRGRREVRREEPAVVAAPPPPPPPPTPAQIDERVARAEAQLSEMRDLVAAAERKEKDARAKVDEIGAELKKTRGRAEANHRVYLVAKGEADIWKDKFSALEKRWNELWRELEGIGWKSRTQKGPQDREPRRGKAPRGAGAPAEVAAAPPAPAQEAEVPAAPEPAQPEAVVSGDDGSAGADPART